MNKRQKKKRAKQCAEVYAQVQIIADAIENVKKFLEHMIAAIETRKAEIAAIAAMKMPTKDYSEINEAEDDTSKENIERLQEWGKNL